MIKKIYNNITSDIVLKIVVAIFLILSIFKPASFHDIDFNTILLLFNLMLIIAMVKRVHLLAYISNSIINHVRTTRQISAYITLTAFLLSMVVTNDVAIITLVPLYIVIAHRLEISIVYSIVLITVAANLGSAFTPIGNPQNVFLVEYFHVSLEQFFIHSGSLLVLGLLTIIILIYGVKNIEIDKPTMKSIKIKKLHVLLIWILLMLVLLAQFGIISIWIDTIITVFTVELLHPQSIGDVDYSLLLSFVAFFLIVGILSRMEWVILMIHQFTGDGISTYLTSIGLSQFISNVPTAVLLSKFSADFSSIYYGVSIGGLGTLVASLANLLAYKQVAINAPTEKKKFLKLFTLINVVFLFGLSILKIILI